MFWWELGLVSRQKGAEFSPTTLACPYCATKGAFSRVFRAERTGESPLEDYFSEVWQCQICAQESFIQWHAEKGMIDFRVYPPSIKHGLTEALPVEMGDEYQQAVNAYINGKWDACVVLSRRIIDLVAHDQNIQGKGLQDVIASLVSQGLLTKQMQQWAYTIEALGTGAASKRATQPSARELLIFTRWILDQLYLLPHTIERYKDSENSAE